MNQTSSLITEEWLQEVGFRWHQLDRQPGKQWLLWFGSLSNVPFSSVEDLGIEVAYGGSLGTFWFCWVRSDFAGRYSRLIHLRHLTSQAELIHLIEALSGQSFDPQNHLYGAIHSPEVVRWISRARQASRPRYHEGKALDRHRNRRFPRARLTRAPRGS
jgi:hypothetical protein